MASIKKRPDGTWRARWREYPGGPEKAKQFARKIDAEHFLTDIQHRLLSGTYTPPSAGQIRVEAYAEEWLARRTFKPATHDRIQRELRLYVVPKLGNRPIASLRVAHIEQWAKDLPLAPSSVRTVFQTLSAMLTAAVGDERIPRNPARGAKLPEVETTSRDPLTADEIRALAHAAPEHVRAAVIVAAGTGLRQAELFGLSVDRVNFMRRELRVDRQLWTPAKGKPFFQSPKSKRSIRTVALSTLMVDTLSAHLATFGTGDDGLVFHRDGRPIGRSLGSKYMRTAASGAGVSATWHLLRHTHASLLLSEGVSPAMVAERTGDDIVTLLATYAHVIRSDEDRVRGIVDEVLGVSTADWLRTEAL
jgi:integrase